MTNIPAASLHPDLTQLLSSAIQLGAVEPALLGKLPSPQLLSAGDSAENISHNIYIYIYKNKQQQQSNLYDLSTYG